MNIGRNLGGSLTGVELEQSQRPQHGAHGLDSFAQQLAKLFAVTLGEANAKAAVGAPGLL